MKQYVCENCTRPCTMIVHEEVPVPRWCPYDEGSCNWVEVDEVRSAPPKETDALKDLVDIITHMYENGYNVFGENLYIEERLSRVRKMFKEEEE